MTKKQKKVLIRIIIAAVLVIALQFIPVKGYVRFGLYMIPYFVIGYDILKKAGKGILNRQIFDENFLMAVATIGAIALGDYKEGTAVMLFYQIGELFQSYAVGKSRRNISDLMDIRPDYANVEKDGELEQVDPDEIEIGTVIVVQPGEKVPIDGVVVEGTSSLNTSALTGESVPREVSVVAILTSILRKLRLANAKFRCWISSKKHSLWKRKDRSCLIFIAKLLWTDILILSFLTVLDSRNIKQPLTKQYVVLSVTAMMNSS